MYTYDRSVITTVSYMPYYWQHLSHCCCGDMWGDDYLDNNNLHTIWHLPAQGQ